jgi:hypothetical protein
MSYINKGSAIRFFGDRKCICNIVYVYHDCKKFYHSIWVPVIHKILSILVINCFCLAQRINLSNLKINYYNVLLPTPC